MDVPVDNRAVARRLADETVLTQVEFFQSYARAYISIYGDNDKLDDEFYAMLPSHTREWFLRMFRAGGRVG